ncbi:MULTISPECIES: PP2C family protein-serine/threonine phosphatase [unclassified Streptomyces]|uniref:PP2C family protein-serine/threonine phosphatase n=1 Tax=unclassified Streptomyces TaxID=2593676 RepID=UPI0035DB42E4
MRHRPAAHAAAVLTEAGAHSCLAVPLVARGRVLGALGLARARDPLPFSEDDTTLALELASRAAVSIDHARWYQNQRQAAENLQRSLLPQKPPYRPGLDIACRYRPASTICGTGGDWYDVIALSGDKTALVIGDVMGSGTGAAARSQGGECTRYGLLRAQRNDAPTNPHRAELHPSRCRRTGTRTTVSGRPRTGRRPQCQCRLPSLCDAWRRPSPKPMPPPGAPLRGANTEHGTLSCLPGRHLGPDDVPPCNPMATTNRQRPRDPCG